MEKILSYILPAVYFILFNFSVTIITKKKFGSCLPITFIVSVLSLFISQFLFKTFNVGFIINIIFALFSVGYVIYKLIRKENIKEIKELFFSKGFYCFITIYIVFLIIDATRLFSQWDEFSHWGVMVKEMLRLDKFYSVTESTLLVHKDYPPFVSLFELLWCKLSGVYCEDLLTLSLHVFEFSLFIPAIDEIKKVDNKINFILKTTVGLLIIIGIIIIFDGGYIFNTIYVDIFLMILFAFNMYQVYSMKEINKFNIFKLVLSLVALILTKQMGMVLFLLTIFYFLVNFFIKNKISKKTIKKIIILLIFIVLLPYMFHKLWSIYINSLNLIGQFNISSINFKSLPDILLNNGGEAWQHTLLVSFFKAIFRTALTDLPALDITSFSGLIISLLLLSWICHKEKNKETTGKMIVLGIVTTLGFIGYCAVMFILYLFCFGEYEASILASFTRYMSTFIIGLNSISIMIMINNDSKKNKRNGMCSLKKLILCLAILIVVGNTNIVANMLPAITKPRSEHYAILEEDAIQLMGKIAETAKVFIATKNNIEATFVIKYYANPITTNMKYVKLPEREDLTETIINEFKNEISKFDYIYLIDVDDECLEPYKFLFENLSNLKDREIYKINLENNEIKFKKV